jgi:hypothetical protein
MNLEWTKAFFTFSTYFFWLLDEVLVLMTNALDDEYFFWQRSFWGQSSRQGFQAILKSL